MNTRSDSDMRIPATEFFGHLEAAWNAADGERFGAEFADDTDFVNIRGEHHRGGPALHRRRPSRDLRHDLSGSTNSIRLDRVREISPGCLLVHATSTLEAPTGPLAGTHQATMSALLVQHDGRWRATAFHNTLVTH